MGYQMTAPSSYLVIWHAAGIIKPGYSHKQRWRKFLLQGADLLQLRAFDTHTDAFRLEAAYDTYLRSVLPYAFTTKTESTPYLGPDGAGWAECFRLPADPDCVSTVLAHCARIADASCGRIAPAYARTDVRTDLRR